MVDEADVADVHGRSNDSVTLPLHSSDVPETSTHQPPSPSKSEEGRSILSYVNQPTLGDGEMDMDGPESSSVNTMIVICIFLVSVFGLMAVYTTFPRVEESDKPYLKLPTNIEDAKILGDILSRYKEKNYVSVLAGVFVFYIFLQTFAIPGSIFLSILSGFLFPFFVALGLICFCSATGASLCYMISHLVGRKLVYHYFPERVEEWAETVKQHRENLTNYIIFLRITPFLPNWFINIAAPIIDVPLLPFWLGTFVGVAPPSFLAIQAGTTLQQLSSSNSILSWTSLIVLVVVGLVSLLPIVCKRILKTKFE